MKRQTEAEGGERGRWGWGSWISERCCVTTWCRMAATQTTLQDKLCFIHVHAVTQKVLQLKAVRADSQLFIKPRNVSWLKLLWTLGIIFHSWSLFFPGCLECNPTPPAPLIYTSFYYLSCKNPCVLNAALIMGWQTVSGAQHSGKWEFLVLLLYVSSFP